MLLRLDLWSGYDLGCQPGEMATLNVDRAKADHINRRLSCVDADLTEPVPSPALDTARLGYGARIPAMNPGTTR